MTVAERIKRETKPFCFIRIHECFRNSLKINAICYGDVLWDYVNVLTFIFIDGSVITVRFYG